MEFLKWSDSRVGTWEGNSFIWKDVFLIDEIIRSGGGNIQSISQIANKLPKKKKRRLITIILGLKNNEYTQSKYKSDDDYKITVEDIKLLIDSRQKIITMVNVKEKK